MRLLLDWWGLGGDMVIICLNIISCSHSRGWCLFFSLTFFCHQDQYVFLNQCVLDIIRAQKDSKVDLIYQNTTAMTIYENLEPVSMFGKTNGYIA